MHDANPFLSAEARRIGRRGFLVALIGITVLSSYCHFSDQAKERFLQDLRTAMDLQVAISAYKIDSNRFPIPDDRATAKDVTARSRGLLVSILIGENPDGRNPKDIKFMGLPKAKERQSGLWREGEEWVLSDQWGEPFYIILDTNGDGKIANPLLEAEAAGAGRANGSPGSPPIEVLKSALVYSAGKDRDPKTWNDNLYVSPLK
jgi:hypothetical protein